jgi:hypothetical protein
MVKDNLTHRATIGCLDFQRSPLDRTEGQQCEALRRGLGVSLRTMGTDGSRPAGSTVAEKQERRFRFLHRLYESTDGNTSALVDVTGLAGALGFKTEEATSLSAYLAHEGLIQGTDWIVLTHAGVLEVEAALSKPSEPTAHFRANIAAILDVSVAAPAPSEVLELAPIAVTPIAVAPEVAAPVAVAPVAVAPVTVAPIEHSSHADIRVLLDLITAELDKLGLVGDMRREVVADIASARAQLGSPKPKASILREVLRALHDVVEGAIGSGRAPHAAWAPILAQLGQLAGTRE